MSWLTSQRDSVKKPTVSTDSPRDSMRAAMIDAGFEPPDYIEPGRVMRFPAQGKGQANRSAWCLLFDDLKCGVYGDWTTDAEYTWVPGGGGYDALSDEDKAAIARAKQARDEERKAARESAAKLALSMWSEAAPAEAHDYLTHKQIDPYTARITNANALLLPVIDEDRKLHSLQQINLDGRKKFLADGAISGNFIPVQIGDEDKKTLIISTGFATGASLAKANAYAKVIAALNDGNLDKVASKMRANYTDWRIIIAGDDDRMTEGNPGRTKATKAADRHGCEVALPEWPQDAPQDLTDFNDLACLVGHDSPLLAICSEPSEDMQLLLADDDEEFAKIISQAWLYDDAIPSSSVGIFYGPSGVGKSFVALDFGMCLASGRSWHSFEHGTPGDRSTVIYVSAEGGRGMRIRKRAWEEQNRTKVPELRVLPKPYMLNEDGDTTKLMTLIRQWIERTGQRVSAVIIDTLAQCNSEDENSTKDASALTRNCTKLAQEFECSAILIHHTGKDEDSGMRGSSAYKGNTDFQIKLVGGVDSTVRMTCEKQKDIEKFNDVSITFDKVEISGAKDYKGRPVQSLVARSATFGEMVRGASQLKPDEKIIVDTYRELGYNGFIESEKLKRAFFAHHSIQSKSIEAKRRSYSRAVSGLKDKAIAIIEGSDIAITYDRQDE
jgi:putative DNA primase/helicase